MLHVCKHCMYCNTTSGISTPFQEALPNIVWHICNLILLKIYRIQFCIFLSGALNWKLFFPEFLVRFLDQTEQEMNTLVKTLAKYIDLKLVKKEDPKQLSQLTRAKSNNSMFSAQAGELSSFCDFSEDFKLALLLNVFGLRMDTVENIMSGSLDQRSDFQFWCLVERLPSSGSRAP